MSLAITVDDCTSCGACEAGCPIECIAPDPAHRETPEALLAKKARLHPG